MSSSARRWILNPLVLLGALVATIGLGASVFALVIDVSSGRSSPYQGVLTFVLYPSAVVFGLVLVAIGAFLERRRARRQRAAGESVRPMLDPSVRAHRAILVGLFLFGALLLGGTIVGAYRAFEYSESTEFCGSLCHQPMEPQYVAYQHSPHSRVACVDCHVGPGVGSYVDAKVSGLRQVAQMVGRSYERPIRATHRRPPDASKTCEHCHGPQGFGAERVDTRERYGYDLRNSRRTLRMLLRPHGSRSDPRTGARSHWHGDIAGRVRFRALDAELLEVARVEVDRPDGSVVTFDLVSPEGERVVSDASVAGLEEHTMDCLDCHNRPAHRFLSPDEAVDREIESGAIDASLAFIKSVAVRALSREYDDARAAEAGIRREVADWYRDHLGGAVAARSDALERAAGALAAVWRRNVFPQMGVDWTTYPDHIGHRNAPGCFRCHAGRHRSRSGETLSSDCATCHAFFTQAPGTSDLLAAPADASHVHPFTAKSHENIACHDCHRGADSPYARCGSCHEEMLRPHVLAHGFDTDCSLCHAPGVPRVEDRKCASCHPSGASALHAVVEHGECSACHRPHSWQVTDWRDACERCHATLGTATWETHHPGQACSPCHDFRGVGAHLMGLPVTRDR